MDKDIDVLNALIKYLISHGYPENSFSLEWPIGRYRVDLAIIDPDINKPIALFEIKRKRTKASEKMGWNQYNNISNAMGDEFIPFYLVFGKEGDPPFEMLRFEKEKTDIEDVELFSVSEVPYLESIRDVPDFNTIRSSEFRKSIYKTEKKREDTLSSFMIICWFSACIVLAFLILDFLGHIDITPERLTLIGIMAGLFILPFASKLKILGFEYERLREKE